MSYTMREHVATAACKHFAEARYRHGREVDGHKSPYQEIRAKEERSAAEALMKHYERILKDE